MAYGKNAPFGLRPLSSLNGGCWTEKTNTYYISADAAGANTYDISIFTGDPVIWNPAIANQGGGTIARYTFNTADQNVGNDTPVIGVFMGCEYTTPDGKLVKSQFWPASTLIQAGTRIKALVIDDPSALFTIQVSTQSNVLNGARFPYGLEGQNFGFGLAGGGAALVPNNPADGNTRTGQSAVYLTKEFTANADQTVATLPLKVLYHSNNVENLENPISYVADATTAPFLNVIVQINNHAYRPGSIGIVAA